MFWTLEKLSKRIQELEPFRYRNSQPIKEFACQIDEQKENGVRGPISNEWSILRLGDRWQGRDRYLWLKQVITIPSEWEGRTPIGLFDFGKTGAGNISGFESLLFVNGKPFQGVDANHKEVFLPSEFIGSQVELLFRLWSGLEGGGVHQDQVHELRKAEIACLDEAADDLYYTGRAVLETAKLLSENQPEHQELLRAIDRALLKLDWSRPGSEDFYQSVREAQDDLTKEVASWEKRHAVTVRCIGHTHIDVAWLWRLTHTREKSARSFSTVLRLMERYPEYVFLQTQPQLYEYIKTDYPDIYEQMKERIKEGRWEADGSMWLEADCNLTSGESLVRQLLYGTRFLRNEFGVECTYLWLPDVFGYSWALPQILKKSGIHTFMTTKISWNQYNRMPHDTFQWRGIDGTEVLTHFVTTPDVPGSTAWFYTYNGVVEPFSVKGIWDSYRDKGVNQELLLCYGYGDGGGGVNRDMLEMRRRLDKMPGLPQVVTGRVDEYFERLHETVKETDNYVHTWDGELYLEFHRGTYTSQAYNKRMNRKLELLYREAEWLQVMYAVTEADWSRYPGQALYEGWKIVLRNQFHDIIPGSSIPEVYEDSRIEYAEAERIGREAVQAAAAGLITAGDANVKAITVWNSSSFVRSEIVTIPIEALGSQVHWVDAAGEVLSSQLEHDKWLVQVPNVPSLGYATVFFREGIAASSDKEESVFLMDANGRGISTPFYDIQWNESGQLTSIWDRINGRQVLADGENGNVFQVFEDKPKDFDAWDIDIFYQEKQREITALQSAHVSVNGLLRAVVIFEWTYMDSVIKQEMIVYANSRRIDFSTVVDWQERQQLLKVAFPVSVRSTEATYDIQFGNVKRPTHWNTSWDYARFESVGHQWVDLSERGYGVSLLNDCKYGHDIKDHTIRLSLIKSAIYPDPLADKGIHQFTYSLLPHQGDWVVGETVKEAWSLNNPLHYSAGHNLIDMRSMFQLSSDYVIVDSIKKAEDSHALIIRLHEYTGLRHTIKLTSGFEVKCWQECDLMERATGDIVQGDTLELFVKPYEIRTIKVTI
ncbi:alpha-mannosidase [Paenibacillus sp. SI8]|uniref:alpha-mannosidase n=1 Tax=unclassified Paenibacillus TaxID=185978 RepID=UPI003466D01B